MVFRKLFKEPGPPRARHSQDGHHQYPLYPRFLDSSSLPPLDLPSSQQYPATMHPTQLIGIQQSAFQSAPFYTDHSRHIIPMMNQGVHYHQPVASQSDQVYPGITYRPPSDEDRAKGIFSNVLTPGNDIQIKQRKGHWKRRFFSSDFTGKNINHRQVSLGELLQGEDQGNISATSIYPMRGTYQKTRLQKAMSILRKGKLLSGRRCSFDDLPITSSKPTEPSVSRREGMTTRKSLDSAFNTVKSHRVEALQPFYNDSIQYYKEKKSYELNMSGFHQHHLQQNKHDETIQSDEKLVGEGAFLYASKGVAKTEDKNAKSRQLGAYTTQHSPVIAPDVNQNEHHPSIQAFTNQEEYEDWQRVHRDAVQKYEDWINDISKTHQTPQMKSSEQQKSKALPSNSDMNAVIKIKNDTKRTPQLAHLFTPSIDYEKQTTRAPLPNIISLGKRGFAEKMFADDPILKAQADVKGKRKEIDRVAVGKPLPETPDRSIQIQGDDNSKSKLRKPIPSDSRHADIRSFDWGSLGPPSHLSLPTIASKVVNEKKQLPRKVKTPLPDQCINAASFLDSSITPYSKRESELIRRSTDAPTEEIASRIQAWRIKTSATPTKKIYAASASPTEGSTYENKRMNNNILSSGSDLTSVSRRATVDNNAIRDLQYQAASESQVTVKRQDCSPHTTPNQPKSHGKSTIEKPGQTLVKVLATKKESLQSQNDAVYAIQESNKEDLATAKEKSDLFAKMTASRVMTDARTDDDQACDWNRLVSSLAHCLDSDANNVVEVLLDEHGEEIKQLYKDNPDFILMLTLRVKRARKKEEDIKREAERLRVLTQEKNGDASKKDSSKRINDEIAHPPRAEIGNSSADVEVVRFGDEEFRSLQTSLLDLHQRISEWRGDTDSLAKRVNLLEQTVYETS